MKRILVAVDGSGESLKGAGLAAGLARGVQAELHIVSVAAILPADEQSLREFANAEGIEGGVNEAAREIARDRIEDAAQQIGSDGLSVHKSVLRGDVTQSIIDYAKQHDIDAIVVGARGHSPIAGLLLGSVSQKLASHAPCTLVIAR